MGGWSGARVPLGYAAIATAAALTVVVAVRVAPVAPPTRLAVAWLASGYALAIAVARLVETVHPLTDVLGGGATGLVATLGGALALTAVSGSERSRQPSAPGGRRRRPTVQWRHLRGRILDR